MLSDGQHHLHHHRPSPCRNIADLSATPRQKSLAEAAAQINVMALQNFKKISPKATLVF
jgi:hypothetical protein